METTVCLLYMWNEWRAAEHIIVLSLGIQGFQLFNKQEQKG